MNRVDSNAPVIALNIAKRGFAALLLTAAALTPTAAYCAENVVRNAGAVTYVSGGVTDETLAQLKSMERDYNLKMVFALKSGAYMSDVSVAIVDAGGKQVLETRSDGPLLLVKLPPGDYQILASASGTSLKQSARVASGQLKTLDFRWAGE